MPRFDVLRDNNDTSKFIFHEVHVDDAAVAVNLAASHTAPWLDLKAPGGVLSQKVVLSTGCSSDIRPA